MCDLNILCFPFKNVRQYSLATELLARYPLCTPNRLSAITTGCNTMFGTTATVQEMKLFEEKAKAMDKDAFRERPLSYELKEALDSISDSDCKLPHYVLAPALDFLDPHGAQVQHARICRSIRVLIVRATNQFVCKECGSVLNTYRLARVGLSVVHQQDYGRRGKVRAMLLVSLYWCMLLVLSLVGAACINVA